MMGKFTETANLSLWEVKDSGPTLGSQNGTEVGPLHLGDGCIAWSSMGPLAMGPGPASDV